MIRMNFLRRTPTHHRLPASTFMSTWSLDEEKEGKASPRGYRRRSLAHGIGGYGGRHALGA